MDGERNKSIAAVLDGVCARIENDDMDGAYSCLSAELSKHPEWVDERMRSEMNLMTKLMESRVALKDYAFLHALALVYKYCEANYGEAGRLDEGEAFGSDMPDADVIWWCWLQGADAAPEIVKSCYASLEKLGRRIVVLDEGNISSYVSLPGAVMDKYRAGIIGRTHFSDILRMELLCERGGCWIDATTYISGTDQILPLMDEEALFMYRAGNVSKHIVFDSWFINVRKRSRIMESTRAMLYAYWEREDKLHEYFLLHLMTTIACKLYPDEYSKIPVYSNEPCHVLQYELNKPCTEKRRRQIMQMSNVHKLTWKLEGQSVGPGWLE